MAGRIFVDADEDGLWNAAIDSGLSGQTVTLSGTTRLGDPLELTTLTGDAGLFIFPAIPAGTYVLGETQPAGYVDYTDTVGTGGGVLAGDAPDHDLIAGIVVTDNTDIGGYAFGELVALSIDATEFVDYDADGAPGNIDDQINGISITLSGFDFRGRAVLMTALTGDAGSGSVAFGGLSPGVYTLTAAQPTRVRRRPGPPLSQQPGPDRQRHHQRDCADRGGALPIVFLHRVSAWHRRPRF